MVKMDPLTIIEKRIDNLSQKLGNRDESSSESNIIDEIKSVSSVLSTISSVHEKINDLNNRVYELNRYLDPQYVVNMSDSKIKCKYIIDNEESIRQHSQYMQLCQEKSDVLNSEPLTKIISLSGTIEKLKTNNLENKDQCDQIERCVQQAMETYNQVSMEIMEKLTTINNKIDLIEKTKA